MQMSNRTKLTSQISNIYPSFLIFHSEKLSKARAATLLISSVFLTTEATLSSTNFAKKYSATPSCRIAGTFCLWLRDFPSSRNGANSCKRLLKTFQDYLNICLNILSFPLKILNFIDEFSGSRSPDGISLPSLVERRSISRVVFR